MPADGGESIKSERDCGTGTVTRYKRAPSRHVNLSLLCSVGRNTPDISIPSTRLNIRSGSMRTAQQMWLQYALLLDGADGL